MTNDVEPLSDLCFATELRDQFERVVEREPAPASRLPAAQSGQRPILAVVLVVAGFCLAGSLLVSIYLHRPQPQAKHSIASQPYNPGSAFSDPDRAPAFAPPGSTVRGATPSGPPAWLVAQAQRLAAGDQDPAPSSAAYCLTTRRKVFAAFGEPDQPATLTDVPVYLVVLSGHFTDAQAFTPNGQAIRGTTLVFAADAHSHGILDFGLQNRPIASAVVGPMISFNVPALSPTRTSQASPSPVAVHPLPTGLKPYVGPHSGRLKVIAAKWVAEWRGGRGTEVVIVPTTLAGASSVFGPVIAGQGSRRSFALLAGGTFTSALGGEDCHFIAAEVDTGSLHNLAETWAPGGWDIGSLGRVYSLSPRWPGG
jgi:hypothetical protein